MQTALIAARRPLFLLVLLVAVLTGLTVARWLFPVGVVVYIAAVMLASRDARLSSAARTSAERVRITSPTLRGRLQEIDRAHGAVERAAGQTRGPLTQFVHSVRGQTAELVQQAHALAAKGQTIEQYLGTIDDRLLRDQIAQLDVRIPRTADDYTLQHLNETRAALLDQQKNAEALRIYGERVTAQLDNINANIDNVVAEIVRLRTADAVSADSSSNEVRRRLQDLNADMDAFGRVLDTALAQTSVGA